MAIVTEREQQFLDLLPLLNSSLLDLGVTVIHLTSDTLSEATVTEKTDSRIFFLNTNPRQALFHLCKVSSIFVDAVIVNSIAELFNLL